VLFDWQAGWACDQPNHPTGEVSYVDAPVACHGALRALGVTADVVRPGADLSSYGLVVVPTLFMVDDDAVAGLQAYVEGGGRLVVTYLSGIVDPDSHVRLGGYPGAFTGLLGVRTEEFFPMVPGVSQPLARAAGWGDQEADDAAGWTGSTWSELTHLEGAEAVASWADGPLAGQPVVTRHRVGAGEAWYVATALDPDALQALLGRLCADAGIRAAVSAGPGVEIVRRSGQVGSFLFAINHGSEGAHVAATGVDLVSGRRLDGGLELPGGACALVRED
jgi:beta-galactosidase